VRRVRTTAKTTDKQVSGLSGTNADIPTTVGAEKLSGSDFGSAMPSDADTAARDGRFTLREGLRRFSQLERFLKCGLSVLAGGVTPVLRKGRAGYAGVVTCGSVHVCPCCGTSIRATRQAELEAVGIAWECESCGLAMMTLTMRHYDRQKLMDLVEYQRTAWRESFGQNAKRGWRTAKVTFGIRGYIRAWEVTHGENGWHAHYHVLLFLARNLDAGQVAELQAAAFTAWYDALLKIPGAYAPNEKYGVRIDAANRGEAGDLARYLMKNQDGKASWGIAAELTRQDVKEGREDSLTPFQIARLILDPATGEKDRARYIVLWREFERAATGIRSLYWSNGLKALLREMGIDLDDRTDGKVAEDAEKAGARLAMIPAATWYRHIAHVPGRALALLKAAERGGTNGIRLLIESWGLVWGADIFDAEELAEEGATLTAAEVMRRDNRAEMVARIAVWRRAFAVAEMAEDAKQFEEKPDEPQYKRRAAAVKKADAKLLEAVKEAEAIRTEGGRNDAQAEFLRRRRISSAARAGEVAASMSRIRDREKASASATS
jgi:ribosomal protein L37AE/L43A